MQECCKPHTSPSPSTNPSSTQAADDVSCKFSHYHDVVGGLQLNWELDYTALVSSMVLVSTFLSNRISHY
jgi:hypothetical protein